MSLGLNAQTDQVRTSNPASKGGFLGIYPVVKKISGRVARADGSPVKTRFYVQDISQTPPVLVTTHINDADGFYNFDLGVGQWRVVPISSEFKFEPRAREYDVRLQFLRQ